MSVTLESFLRDQMRKGLSEFRLRSFISGDELSVNVAGASGEWVDCAVKGTAVEVAKIGSPGAFRLLNGWKTDKVVMRGGTAHITASMMGRSA